MAKNKGKYRTEREKAEKLAADQPLAPVVNATQKYVSALRPHRYLIAAVASALLIFIAVMTTWGWVKRRRATKATNAYTRVVAVLDGTIVETEEPPAADAPPEPVRRREQFTFKTKQEQQERALAELVKLREEHGSAELAAKARLVEAGLLYDLERYDEALTSYRGALKGGLGDLAPIAREGIGYSLEAKAFTAKSPEERERFLDEALTAFGAMAPEPNDPSHPGGLYHQARVKAMRQKQGDLDDAKKLYHEISEKYPDSSYAASAKDRLEQLEEQG